MAKKESFEEELARRTTELEDARQHCKDPERREEWLRIATEYAEWRRGLRVLDADNRTSMVKVEESEGN